jgi:peptidoglycan/xylan/chitin deacetylase (PgdA/CDA1 family)
VAVMLAAVIAWAASGRRAAAWVLVGPVLATIAAVLYVVTASGTATVVIAVVAGAAAGIAAPRPWRPASWTALGAMAGAVSVIVAGRWAGERWGVTVAVAATALAAIVGLLADRPRRPGTRSRWGWAVPITFLVVAAALLGWTGANDPQLSWFGAVTSRGPRDEDRVAITFDDGPNDTATLAVRDILDRHGVKATFFLVGKALDARPDLARALYDDGMLLGNHSYHHDQWRWLDPRYPELARTQAAFARQLGVCPRFYRPPHGQRTPFVSLAVHDRGMSTVTWNVSAGDWATDDPAVVASRVLRRVRPGSIILLHDGLDGNVTADRSVIVAALPRILDGLAKRGLRPVRLDELLGGPAYLDHC